MANKSSHSSYSKVKDLSQSRRRFNLRVEDFRNCSMENKTHQRIQQSRQFIMQSKKILGELESTISMSEYMNIQLPKYNPLKSVYKILSC